MRHEAGVLMPEEYDLHRFHDWVRERHAALKTPSADSAR
jgi:Rieske 2Fe-2S family protein